MRNGILMTLLMWCSLSYAQTILTHEKKVDIALKYQSREINFINSTDNVMLSGSLVVPNSNYNKIVIIVPGSGKDTRHSHHILVQELLKKNIAVYRFDDRGVGKSEGQYSNSIEKLALDIVSASKRLKSISELKNKEIGLLGHSLGGMATILACNSNNQKFDFSIQIATPVDSFIEATKHQLKTLPYFKIKNKTQRESELLFSNLIQIVNKNSTSSISQILQKGYQFLKTNGIDVNDVKFWSYSHVMLYQYQFRVLYKNQQIPTMYIIGSKDKFINMNQEVQVLRNLKNPKINVKVLEGLNHYLSKGKLNNNTYDIDKTASDLITSWIDRI